MSNKIYGKTLVDILGASTKLGLTSFGGPIAHLGYFKNEYVDKRKWLDDKTYAELIALCQFLPGPASSQVGIAIGVLKGGILGGILAWIGFTLPSVIALVLFALLAQNFNFGEAGWIEGLKIVAVAVVTQAIWGMGQKLAPDQPRITVTVIAAIFTLLWPSALGQIIIILAAGAAGIVMYKNAHVLEIKDMNVPISKRTGIIAWVLFFGLLLGLPILRQLLENGEVVVFDTFYRVGSLVFGGGHVVLPLLEREVVPPGWISTEEFLAGYGVAQAVPGPLFTFASYLGVMINGINGGVIATLAIFLPSFFLIIGSLPFLNELRHHPKFHGAFTAINAAVVGILLAALYDPIWTSSIKSTYDFALAIALFGMLVFWKIAPWIVVITGSLAGLGLSFFTGF